VGAAVHAALSSGHRRMTATPGAGHRKAVLFDLDDTLFDHRACTRAALLAIRQVEPAFERWAFEAFEAEHAALLEENHLEVLAGRLTVDDARLRRFGRLLERAGAPCGPSDVEAVARAYREAYRHNRQEVPGALDLLAALQGSAAIGIVTNNVAAEQRQKLAEFGFDRRVDAVVISEDVGITKPDPGIFRIALDRLGCDAASAVMVGDAWGTDIVGARSAGLRAVWFNRTGAASPEPAVPELRELKPADAVAALILRELR
jgi:HAD superfamily hydrolase (TIGR01549 family)